MILITLTQEKGLYFRDGNLGGRFFKVCKTFLTSPSPCSDFTSPGTESSTQSCSASENRKGTGKKKNICFIHATGHSQSPSNEN